LAAPADERQRAAVEAVLDVAGRSGLPLAGAGVWRAGSAVLVGLPAVPALARVDEPGRAADADRQVVVAGVLASCGVGAVRPVGPAGQPVASPAGPVTIWAWEAPVGPSVTPAELGRAARRLHDRTRDLPPPRRTGLPLHDPLAAVRAELLRAQAHGATPTDDLVVLAGVADRLAEAWPDPSEDPLGVAVVHGDLHLDNVVPASRGPVLADLELAGWGPASADVAPPLVAVRRYGAPGTDVERFLEAYGADPRGWPGLEVLVEGYELWVTAWAVANRTGSARAEREARVRTQRWRSGSSPPWSLH
jgi:hypothetical protein